MASDFPLFQQSDPACLMCKQKGKNAKKPNGWATYRHVAFWGGPPIGDFFFLKSYPYFARSSFSLGFPAAKCGVAGLRSGDAAKKVLLPRGPRFSQKPTR